MKLRILATGLFGLVATACNAVTPVASESSTGLLKSMTAGDRGCYLEIADAAGAVREAMAAFEICEQESLVGKKVAMVSRTESVSAESCQGDPECSAREDVMLVVEMSEAK